MNESLLILMAGMFIWIVIGISIGALIFHFRRRGFVIFGIFWGFIVSFTLMLGGSIIISNIPWLNAFFIF